MENETVKLVNVMKRIARAAGYAAWVKSETDSNNFLVSQYNKVLKRLTELEPTIGSLFATLPDDASPHVIRLAAREVLAYFEADEPEFAWGHRGHFAYGCRPHRLRSRRMQISACS